MRKKIKVNLMASSIVGLYLLIFMVMTLDGNFEGAFDTLLVVFFIPTITMIIMGYNDQPPGLIWSVILAEGILFFFIVRMIVLTFVTSNQLEKQNFRQDQTPEP